MKADPELQTRVHSLIGCQIHQQAGTLGRVTNTLAHVPEIDVDQKFELDVQYVQSVSLWYDIKILFQSLSVVVSSKGVTPPGAELMAPFTGSSAHPQTQLDLGS